MCPDGCFCSCFLGVLEGSPGLYIQTKTHFNCSNCVSKVYYLFHLGEKQFMGKIIDESWTNRTECNIIVCLPPESDRPVAPDVTLKDFKYVKHIYVLL